MGGGKNIEEKSDIYGWPLKKIFKQNKSSNYLHSQQSRPPVDGQDLQKGIIAINSND